MKKILLGAFALLLLGGSFLAGSWYSQSRLPQGSSVPARKILYYIDPMHPSYKSDKPGIAPDCGMELVPVYEDGSMGGPGGGPVGSPPGTVQVSSEKQQLLGVQVGAVERSDKAHALRVLGRVSADETRLYFINATVDGWITHAAPVSTGSLVKKSERLGSFYSPEFLSAQQAFLFALSSKDRVQTTGRETPAQAGQVAQFNINIQQYRDTLKNLGMGDSQIDQMIRMREYSENIHIESPADGFILARNISPGLRFEKGRELFRIADLGRVWILADAYENEAQHLKPGITVKASLPNQQRTFNAKVTHIMPQFDGISRTLKVRLEADNPGFLLRPDMFVDLEVPVTLPAAITVPVDAVVDSGVKKTVYVDKGNGVFEPRRVETGWRMGDRVEIVKGLMPGEKIVVSGTFLIDSESRMKAAAAGITGETSEDPVCGMDIDQSKARAAGLTTAYKGQTFYFCSDECKISFEKEPARYTAKAGSGSATGGAAGSKQEDQAGRRSAAGGAGGSEREETAGSRQVAAGSKQEVQAGRRQQAGGSERKEQAGRKSAAGGAASSQEPTSGEEKMEAPHAGDDHSPGKKR